jgi:oligosaccharyltransferase complex subunit beta
VEDMADSFTPPKLLEFIDEGGNLLVTANPDLGHVVREIGTELGFEFDTKNNYVLDHFEKTDPKDASYIKSREFGHVVSEHVRKGNAVGFHGIGHVLSGESQLAFPILMAGRYAFTEVPQDESNVYPFAIGRRILLVSGFQARNNARFLILGDCEMLQNT